MTRIGRDPERRISLSNKTVKVSKMTRRLVWQENFAAYMFLLPFLMFFVAFVLYPDRKSVV